MTIQEAIKSGKPFKRASWTNKKYLILPMLPDDTRMWDCNRNIYEFTISDILATDWKIKQ